MQITEPANYLDHMLKQTRQHHVTLSAMADTKANMLLTMSSVVSTLCLPQLANDHYRLPLAILMSACLLTIILACYAVMPKLSFKHADAPIDTTSQSFNPLFFGDFQALAYPEYVQLMEAVMNDPSSSYEMQLREIYTMGQYLARKKYRLLRWAYLSFLSGFICAGMAIVLTW